MHNRSITFNIKLQIYRQGWNFKNPRDRNRLVFVDIFSWCLKKYVSPYIAPHKKKKIKRI